MVVESIGTATRDFATITLWEADGPTTGDIGECYNDSVFDEAVVINAASGLTLRVAAGEKHDGTAGTGARNVLSAGGHAFQIAEDDFTIEDLEIHGGTSASDECIRFGDTTATTTVNRCILRGTPSDNQSDGIYTPGTCTVVVNNCIIYDTGRSNVSPQGGSGKTWTLTMNHCTLWGAGVDAIAIHNGGTVVLVMNGCLIASDSGCFVNNGSTMTVTLNDCITDDATATNVSATMTNVLESETFADTTGASAVIYNDITGGSEDFHLQDHANNLAIDHVDSARLTVTDDIEDEARPDSANNDAGADEIAAAGTVIAQVSSPVIAIAPLAGVITYSPTIPQTSSPVIAIVPNAGTVTFGTTIAQVASPVISISPNNGTIVYTYTIPQTTSPDVLISPNNGTLIYSPTIPQTASPVIAITPFDGTVVTGAGPTQVITLQGVKGQHGIPSLISGILEGANQSDFGPPLFSWMQRALGVRTVVRAQPVTVSPGGVTKPSYAGVLAVRMAPVLAAVINVKKAGTVVLTLVAPTVRPGSVRRFRKMGKPRVGVLSSFDQTIAPASVTNMHRTMGGRVSSFKKTVFLAKTEQGVEPGVSTYLVGFPFLDKAHLLVQMVSVGERRKKKAVTQTTQLILGVDWDVDAAGTSVVLTVLPSVNQTLVITRVTPHVRPEFEATGGAQAQAAMLDRVLRQMLYYTEELEDKT